MTDDATATMVANLPERTGRSLDAWLALLAGHSMSRHGEGSAFLKNEHGVSHGYANLLARRHLAAGAAPETGDDLVAAQYSGGKTALRPLYDALVERVRGFGDDVEIAPKKASVSLRRTTQFGLLTPATRARLDVGLNLAGEPPTSRLREKGGMCSHVVAVTRADDVDAELVGWLRQAYDRH